MKHILALLSVCLCIGCSTTREESFAYQLMDLPGGQCFIQIVIPEESTLFLTHGAVKQPDEIQTAETGQILLMPNGPALFLGGLSGDTEGGASVWTGRHAPGGTLVLSPDGAAELTIGQTRVTPTEFWRGTWQLLNKGRNGNGILNLRRVNDKESNKEQKATGEPAP